MPESSTLTGSRRGRVSAEILRFLVSAGLSFGVNLGFTWLVHDIIGQRAELAFAVGQLSVFLLNFVVARYYVFQATGERPLRQFRKYVVTSLSFRGAEYLAYVALHSLLGIHYLLTATAVLSASFCLKFFVYRAAVFRRVPSALASRAPGEVLPP
jgi:putative flippase GtrA